jgi:hypothetical protein
MDHSNPFQRAKGLSFILFIPLESPSIYAGDVRNKKHQLLIGGRVKAQPFLTGFGSSAFSIHPGAEIKNLLIHGIQKFPIIFSRMHLF